MSRDLELIKHTVKYYRYKLNLAAFMQFAIETYEEGNEGMSWYYLIQWAEHNIDNKIYVDIDGCFLANGVTYE